MFLSDKFSIGPLWVVPYIVFVRTVQTEICAGERGGEHFCIKVSASRSNTCPGANSAEIAEFVKGIKLRYPTSIMEKIVHGAL
jgi:hypothetical protein